MKKIFASIKYSMMLFLCGLVCMSYGHASSWFTTTTTTGYTATGYFEQTVYDLQWEMLWFDNSGWKPQLSLSQVISNGIAWVDNAVLNLNTSNEYGTIYRLNLPDILDANNIEVTLEGRNATVDQALAGYDFHIYLQGTSGNAEVNFIGVPFLGDYTRLAAGDHLTENNGDLVERFSTWEDIGLKIQNGTVDAMVDGTSVLSRNFTTDLGKLVQVQIDFRGSAKVDNMRIFENGVQRIYEDFNTTGQTTAQLVTYTGYAISTGLSGSTVTTGLYVAPDPSFYFSGYGEGTDDGYLQERQHQQYLNRLKNQENKKIQEKRIEQEDEADPISLHHGAMVYDQTLMQLPSDTTDLMFTVHYNSALTYEYTPLGKGWDHNFNKFLAFSKYDNKFYFGNGMGIPSSFDTAGDNIWQSDALRATVLKLPNNDMRMTFTDGGSIRFRPIRLGYQRVMYRPYVITDRNGNTQFLSWNNDDLLEKVTDSSGNTINFIYNNDNKLIRIEETGGRKVDLSYDTNNDLTNIAVTHAGNTKSTAFTYSSGFPSNQDELNHNMLTITDSKGQVYVSNTYDTNDAVTQQIYGGDSYLYNYTRDNIGRITKVDVNNGRNISTSYTFNNDGLVTTRSRTTVGGGTETYTMSYNNDGRMASYTYPSQRNVAYTYDNQGRIATRTVTAGSLSQQWTYSYVGNTTRVSSITEPQGQTTQFTYDPQGNLVSMTQLNVDTGNGIHNLTTTYSYDSKGLLLATTNPEGTTTSFVYNNKGDIVSVTKAGDTISITRDAYGNITSMTDAEGKTSTYTYNNFNQLVQSTTAEGIIQSMQYDATNNLVHSDTTIGTSTADATMTYDLLDNLASMSVDQTATTAQQYQWTYYPHDLIETITAPNGLVTRHVYDHNDQVILTRISDGTTHKDFRYTYNANSELIKLVVPNGAQTDWIRDGLGRVIEMKDAQGSKILVSYNQQNLPTQVKVKDAIGTTLKKTEYEYNSIGWTTKKKEYTKEGTQWGAIQGNTLGYQQNTPQVYESTYTYNKLGQPTSSTNQRGAVTSMSYDSKDRLFKITDALGNNTFYTYDGRDLITKVRLVGTNGSSYQNRYTYDDDGRLAVTTNNDGKHHIYIYNELNQIVSIKDENGNTTDMTYDYMGNMLTSTQYLHTVNGNGNTNNTTTPVTTTYEYDIMNNMVAMTDAEGNRSEFVYDSFNRMTREIYPDGRRNSYTYDIMDNVLTTTDPNGTVVTNTYGNLNRMTARSINRAAGVGGVTSENYTYDALGRLTNATDNDNQAIAFWYDGLDRVTKEQNGGKYLHYEYDATSNLTKVIYPSTKELTRGFDIADRLTSMDWNAYNQNIDVMDNTYDSLFLLESIFGNQAKTAYEYDNLMRVSSIDHYQSFHPMHNNAGQIIEDLDYNYDDVSNVLGDGQRAYTLDSLYRITDAVYPPNQAAAIKQEKFQYDLVGNRTQFESWVRKGNNAGLINTQTNVGINISNPLVLSQMLVAANGNGNGKGNGNGNGGGNGNSNNGNNGNGNGQQVTVCHNGHEITINQSAVQAHLAQGATIGPCPISGTGTNNGGNGNNGNNSNGNGNGNGNGSNGNNNNNGNSGGSGAGGPTYGGAGGIPGMLTYQGKITYSTNNLNQYTDVTYPRNGSQTNTVNYVYDNNGNILQDDKWEYQYDYRNRMIRAEHMQNGEVLTFKYDVLNRRTQKTNRSKAWKWIYTFHDVAEEDWYMNSNMSAGAIKVREFVYGNGLDDLVYMEQNKPLNYQDEQEEEGYTEVYTGGGFNTAVKRYFFQKDLAGSTKIVSDIQGKVIEMYAYDSFGRIYERNGISGNYRPFQTSRVNHNRFFTNREYDTDLQLYYYRARWYSPALDRFMSRDPLGYADGVNLYAYVGNNPTTYVDPWGTEKVLLNSLSINFVLENTHRLDLNDVESWNRVNAHVQIICMMPENYNHYHCIDTVRGSVQLAGMTDDQVLSLANAVEKVGIVMLFRQGVKYAVKEIAGDESCAALASMFSSPESMMVGGSLCMIGVGSMSQKDFDNIMRMAGKVDDVALDIDKLIKQLKVSPNQISQMIKKGQSPKTIRRIDSDNLGVTEKPHIHFSDGSALNIDGTWKHGGKNLTNKETKWLEQIGWTLPN